MEVRNTLCTRKLFGLRLAPAPRHYPAAISSRVSDLLRKRIAAGHAINLTRDVARFLRSEQDIDRRQFRRLPWPAHRNHPAKFRNLFRRLAPARLQLRPHW